MDSPCGKTEYSLRMEDKDRRIELFVRFARGSNCRDVDAVKPRAEESDPMWTLERLLASPTIASKAWIIRQYDSTVRASTVVGPGPADAAVVMLRGTRRALALKTDCNRRYVYLDPRVGGRIAVAEAARNIACTGARPMAITNCLNFGNPRKPDVFFQFREAVTGMGESARQDFNDTGVRVTLIEPGMVDTPFFDNPPQIEALHAEDVARAVMFAVTQPARVDVNEILIRPTDQPS